MRLDHKKFLGEGRRKKLRASFCGTFHKEAQYALTTAGIIVDDSIVLAIATTDYTVFGGDSVGVTPVPISNTEVKPYSADDTARETVWERRSPPELIQAKAPVDQGPSLSRKSLF